MASGEKRPLSRTTQETQKHILVFLLLLSGPVPFFSPLLSSNIQNALRPDATRLERWSTWLHTGMPAVAHACSVGINYGGHDQSSNPIPKASAVYVMKRIRAGSIKIFQPDPEIFALLEGSPIEVVVGVFPFDLMNVWAQNEWEAGNWIDRHIMPWVKKVNIVTLSVANEVIDPGKGPDMWNVVPGMWAAYNQLKKRGLHDKIKVKTPQYPAFVKLPYPPSIAYMDPDIEPVYRQLVQFVLATGSSLYITNYPFYPYKDTVPRINRKFTLFQGFNGYWDRGYYYQNLFDVMLDGIHVAVEKMGFKNVPLEVAETGWPSWGAPGVASVNEQKQYIYGVMGHVCSNKGTPRRPGRPIKTWIFEAFDENGKGPAEYEKHFGVRTQDGRPKYPLDLSGRYPTWPARPPPQYCLSRPGVSPWFEVSWACSGGGVKCDIFWQRCNTDIVASAIFNAYFQQNNWKFGACSFQGVGMISSYPPKKDPRSPNCPFPGYPPKT